MSAGVFTATMSYHSMLKRAQELSPVLTYVLCKLLLNIKIQEKSTIVYSEHVSVDYSHEQAFTYYFTTDQMQSFVSTVFHNLTIDINGRGQCGGDDFCSRQLIAHKEFVTWLKGLKLTVDDATHSVVIPA